MMSNLTKPNKITVGGGLHARIREADLLKEAIKIDLTTYPNRLAIICDFSGSMGYYESDRKSKLRLLSEAVQDFALRSNPADTAVAVESFPSGFRIDLTNDSQQIYMRMIEIPTFSDTPMGEGLKNGLTHHKPTRAMLISDGEATDGDSSYEEANKYKSNEIIIDCVHIGDSTSGEERLKRIASITGGIYLKFKDVNSFSSNFHYLLPESRATIAGMLPYEVERLLGANEVK